MLLSCFRTKMSAPGRVLLQRQVQQGRRGWFGNDRVPMHFLQFRVRIPRNINFSNFSSKKLLWQADEVRSTRARSVAIAGMYQKSALSFHPASRIHHPVWAWHAQANAARPCHAHTGWSQLPELLKQPWICVFLLLLYPDLLAWTSYMATTFSLYTVSDSPKGDLLKNRVS